MHRMANLKNTSSDYVLYMRICDFLRDDLFAKLRKEYPGIAETDIWEMVSIVANDFLGTNLHDGQNTDSENGKRTISAMQSLQASMDKTKVPLDKRGFPSTPKLEIVHNHSKRTPDIKTQVSTSLLMYGYKLRGKIIGLLTISELREMKGETQQEMHIIQSILNHTANAVGYQRVDQILKEEDIKKYVDTSKIAAKI